MTFVEYCVQYLTERGIDDTDATDIVAAFKDSKASEPMAGRWHEDTANYPAQLLLVLEFSLRKATVDWLKKFKPLHWALPMFDGTFDV